MISGPSEHCPSITVRHVHGVSLNDDLPKSIEINVSATPHQKFKRFYASLKLHLIVGRPTVTLWLVFLNDFVPVTIDGYEDDAEATLPRS